MYYIRIIESERDKNAKPEWTSTETNYACKHYMVRPDSEPDVEDFTLFPDSCNDQRRRLLRIHRNPGAAISRPKS